MTDIRKGCKYCKGELIGFRQKVLRTCSNCAEETRQGFSEMMKGNVKQGFTKVLEKKAAANINNIMEKDEKEQAANILKKLMSNAINKQEKKIIKLAKKRGLNEQEIIQALKVYRGQTK